MTKKPYFLITIDTEGDGTNPENARFLPRFQKLCEQFLFKPTYLTNFIIVLCDGAVWGYLKKSL